MGPKRQSLQERINHYSTIDGRVEFELLDERLDQLDVESVGYRGYYALATIKHQDDVLRLYRNYMKLKMKPNLDSASDDELDLACFPEDHKQLYSQVRGFLLFTIECASPRSSKSKKITYSVAAQYRRYVMYWVNYKYCLRQSMVPPKVHLFNQLTEVLRLSAKRNDLAKSASQRGYIGLAELQYLVDMDTRGTPCIEYAECHHLAWCIGRLTAVRPGSLGPVSKQRMRTNWKERRPYPTWRDMEITRGKLPGTFNVQFNVRSLKTNRVDPETWGMNKKLMFKIPSPQRVENLWISVPHRLLVIALRRKILVDIETLDELFNGDKHFIQIKEEFLDKPILLSAGFRGLSVPDDNNPLKSDKLTEYIGLRAMNAGFPTRITFYSIRCRVASDLTLALGADKAREIMGHDAASHCLEKYYLEFNYLTNTAAILTGEDPDHSDQLKELRAATRHEYRMRLDKKHLAETQGEALNNLVAQLLAEDTNYRVLTKAKDISNYTRRIRTQALHILHEQTHKKFKAQLTQSLLTSRDDEAERAMTEASDFANMIKNIVRKGLRHQVSSDTATSQEASHSGIESDDVSGINFDEDFPEQEFDDSRSPIEPDADQLVDNGGSEEIVRQVIIEDDGEDAASSTNLDIPYRQFAYTHMQLLLENSLNEVMGVSFGEDVQCPLCLDDDSVDQEAKDKLWRPNRLKYHLETRFFHCPYQKWRRQMVAVANGNHGKYYCNYCAEIAGDDSNIDPTRLPHYRSIGRLVDHVKNSNSSRIDGNQSWMERAENVERHDLAKKYGLWYDEDFDGGEEAKSRREKDKTSYLKRAAVITWSRDQTISVGLPMVDSPTVVEGGPVKDIPEAFATLFTTEAPTPPSFLLEGNAEEAFNDDTEAFAGLFSPSDRSC